MREQEGVIMLRSDYFTGKKLFYREKQAFRYIHPRALYVGFTVRVGVKLRC